MRGTLNRDIILYTMKQSSEYWEKTLSAIEKALNVRDYSTWVDNRLSFVQYDKHSGTLYLRVDSDIAKAHLESPKFMEKIEGAVAEGFGASLKLRILLPGDSAPKKTSKDIPASSNLGKVFNPLLTFDNFIVGDNSRFAAMAAQKVAEAPGDPKRSPLFIYGKTGLGKTHLMNAIGLYILKHSPELEVLYVSGEEFVDDYVNASMQKRMTSFKKKYRSVDVLLIDDIQFISEKEKSIEEVFYTYEVLYGLGKQMVFTSDRTPDEILGLDERLRSRFSSGLMADIKPYPYETKVGILKHYAVLEGIKTSEGFSETISYIAENTKTNVRDLISSFNQVVAEAEIWNKELTKHLAREVLKEVLKLRDEGPSVKDIKKVVAVHYGISVSSIDSEERTRSLSRPRQIAMYLCRELTGISFPKLADLFKKDNATVQYGYKKIRDELGINEDLNAIVTVLREKLQTEY